MTQNPHVIKIICLVVSKPILCNNLQEVFMENNMQLEFNLESLTPEQLTLSIMQNQLHVMNESMGKVRRKLFAELGEVKKLYLQMKTENEDLKSKISLLKNEKTEWLYQTNESLFELCDQHISAL